MNLISSFLTLKISHLKKKSLSVCVESNERSQLRLFYLMLNLLLSTPFFLSGLVGSEYSFSFIYIWRYVCFDIVN